MYCSERERSYSTIYNTIYKYKPAAVDFADLNPEWVFAVQQMLLSCQRCFLWNSTDDDDDFNV